MHNFRPGVIERLGLDYASIKSLNPRIVYGQITGYGGSGPWKDKPGQDLLVQALSGLTWLSGNATDGPVPMGIAIADIICGMHLAQGILACLVRRTITNHGGLVEVSMLESVLDMQFETITTFLQDGGQPMQRTATNNAHAYLGAPYGIYRTRDGHLALAMGRIPQLGELLGCPALLGFQRPGRVVRASAIRSSRSWPIISNRDTTSTGCRFSSRRTSGAPMCSIGNDCSSTMASKCSRCCRP